MAYPPPPGHSTLPPKPPPSTTTSSSFRPSNGSAKPAFTAFAPRAVAHSSGANRTTSTAQYSAPPVPSYSAQPSYLAAPQASYPAQPQYDTTYQAPGSAPQIRNPFVAGAPTTGAAPAYGDYDPEYEAQVQQWQSAYSGKDDKSAYGVAKTATPVVKPDHSATNVNSKEAQKTVQRSGGGTTWTDDSLLEWDPAHFRIFVGNLAGEVTDESLLKAFAKYLSVQKARVIRDKRTTKSKGYGFVSFANGDEYFQAAKDMQGKYIGSHPVLIKRAMTEVRATTVRNDHRGKGKNKNKGAGGHNKVEHGGVEKKAPKTKGGLKVLG